MEIKKIRGAIEAILFASGDAVSTDRVAQVLSLDRTTAAKLMQSVMDDFNTEDGGVRIVKLEDSYQMCSNPAYAEEVRQEHAAFPGRHGGFGDCRLQPTGD